MYIITRGPKFYKQFQYFISNYDLQLYLAPRRRRHRVTASLTLTANKATKHFFFLLSSQCQLRSIKYLGISLSHTIKELEPGVNKIKVVLPRRVAAGERLTLTFAYRVELIWQAETTFELAPFQSWYPFSPLPAKYTCKFQVVTPGPIRTISVGKLDDQQSSDIQMVNNWVSAEPFRGLHVVVGKLLKTTRSNGLDLNVYYPREFMNQGQGLANHGQQAIEYLTETLGPVPTPHASIVITKNKQKCIYSSPFVTSISAGVIADIGQLPSSKEKNIQLYYIATRELAHRWLKLRMMVHHVTEQWHLDGLAEYLTWLAVGQRFGIPAQRKIMNQARQLLIDNNATSLRTEANKSFPLPRWARVKAAWLFRLFHGLAGDKFFTALQQVLGQHTELSPAPEDVFSGLGKLCDIDSQRLYRQWANSQARLHIKIKHICSFEDEDGNWNLAFNLLNTGQLSWPFPVELELTLATGETLRQNLKPQRDTHLVTTPHAVRQITIDPHWALVNWNDKNTYTV